MAALMAGTALAGCGGNNGASKADGTADSASKAASGAKGSVYWLNFSRTSPRSTPRQRVLM